MDHFGRLEIFLDSGDFLPDYRRNYLDHFCRLEIFFDLGENREISGVITWTILAN